jgi:Spy/CpxP family protein refolding chaperone
MHSSTKQQALMFLLGALLVGGVLGFATGRVLDREHGRRNTRTAMYDDLQLTVEQRQQFDSILDATNCKRKAILKPVQAQLDSLRREGKVATEAVLTAEQRTRLEARRQDDARRYEQNQASRRRPNACP